jgi:hypothetical protein
LGMSSGSARGDGYGVSGGTSVAESEEASVSPSVEVETAVAGGHVERYVSAQRRGSAS